MYFEYLRSFNKSLISYSGDKRLYEGDYYYGMLFFRKSFISSINDISLFKILSISDNFGYEYFDNVRFLSLLTINNLLINYVLHPLPVVYFNAEEEGDEEMPEEPAPENDLYDRCGMFYNLCSRDDYIINDVNVTVDYSLDDVQTICVFNQISQEYVFSYVKHNVSIDITINYVLGDVYAKFIFVSDVGPSYISPSFTVSNGVNNYSFIIPDYIGDVSGFLYVYIYKSVDDFECQMYRKIFYTRRITSRTFRSSYSYNCLNNQNNYSFIFNRVIDPIFYTEKYLIYYNSSTINPLITGSNVHFSISSGSGTVTVNTYPYSILYNPNTYSFVMENFNINTSQSIYINRAFLVATNYITYFSFNTHSIQSVEVNLLLNNSILASNTYNVNPSGDTVSDSISYTNFDSGMILHVKFNINTTCYIECYYYLNNYLLVFDVTTNYYLDNNSNSYKLDVHIQAYNHWNINLNYFYTFYNASGGGGSLTYSDTSNNTGVSSATFSLPLGGNECNDVQSFIGTDYYLVNNVINSNIITDQSTYTISYINNSFLLQNLLQIDIYYGSGLIFSFITNVDSNNNLIYYPDLRFYIVASYQHYYSILDITILPVNSSYTINSANINVNYVQSNNSFNIYNGTASNNIGNGVNFSSCLPNTITSIDYLYLYGEFNISSPNYNQNINLSFCFNLNRTLSPAANFDLPLCTEYHENNSIIFTHEIRYGLARCVISSPGYNYSNFTLHPNNDYTIESNQSGRQYLLIHYKLHNGYDVNDLPKYKARVKIYTVPNYTLFYQSYSENYSYYYPSNVRYYPDYLNLTVTSYPAFDEISRLLQYHGTTPTSNFPFLEHYDFEGEPVLSFFIDIPTNLLNTSIDLLIVVDILRFDNNDPQCIVNRKSFIYRNLIRNYVKITYKDVTYDSLGFPVSYGIIVEWDLKNDEWIYLLSNAHGNPSHLGICGSDYMLLVNYTANTFPLPNSYSYIYYNYDPTTSSSYYELQNHQVYSNSEQIVSSVHLLSRSSSSMLCNVNNIDFVINKITIMYTEYWLTRFYIIPTEDFIFVVLLSHLVDNEIATVTFNDINVTLNITHAPNNRISAGKFYMRPSRYYNNTQNSIYIQRPSFNYYLNIDEIEVIKLNIVYFYNRNCHNIRFSNIYIYFLNLPSYFHSFGGISINVRIKKLNDQNYNVSFLNTGISRLLNYINYASGNIELCYYVNNVYTCPELSYDNRPNIDNNDCNHSSNVYSIHSRVLISSSNIELIFLYHLNDPDFVNYYFENEIKYTRFVLNNFITPNTSLNISEENPLSIYAPSIMPFIYRHKPFYSHFKVKVTTTETSPGNYSIFIEFLADYLVNDPLDPAVIGNVTYDNPSTYTGILDIYCNGNLIHTVNLNNASSYTYNTNDPCLSPTSWQEKYILLRPTSPTTSYTFRDDQNRAYSCNQDTVLCMTYVTIPQIPPCPNGDCSNTIQNDFQNVEVMPVIFYIGYYDYQINLSSNVARQYNANLDTQDKFIFLLLEVPSGYNYTDISAELSIYDLNTLSLIQSYNMLFFDYDSISQTIELTLSNFNNKPVLALIVVLSSPIPDGYYLLVTDIKYTDPSTSTTCCARRLVNILRVLQYRTLTLDITHSGNCENSDTAITLTLQEVLPYVPENKVEYIIDSGNIQQTNYGTSQFTININNLYRIYNRYDHIVILLYPTTYPPNPYSNDLVLEYLDYVYPSFIEPEFILYITSDYFFAFCVFSVDSNNYTFNVVIGSNSFNTFNTSVNILDIRSGINLINISNVSYSLSYSNMGIIVNSSPFSYSCSGTYTVMDISKTVSLNRNYNTVSINGLQININNNTNNISFDYTSVNIFLQSYNISTNSFSNISNILTGYGFTLTTTHSITLSHNYQLTPTPNTGNTSCTFDNAYGTYLPIYQRTVLTSTNTTYTCRFDIFNPDYVNYVVRFNYNVQVFYSGIYSIPSLYRIISHYTHYYVVVTIQNNGGNNNTITINFLCDYWETDGQNMILLQQGQPAYYTGRIRFIRDVTVQYDVVHTNVSSVSFNCNDIQCNPTNTTNRYIVLSDDNSISSITAPGRETLQLTNNNVIGLCLRNI